MTEKSIWIAPARRRELENGTTPPETRFWPSAWIPASGWTTASRAAFEASETARREECAEYRERWLRGEEISDIRRSIEQRKRRSAVGKARREEITRFRLGEVKLHSRGPKQLWRFHRFRTDENAIMQQNRDTVA
jgi:hypothetical protein